MKLVPPAPGRTGDRAPEHLAMVVFERTPSGMSAAAARDSDVVPQRLRTLLLTVDGRTPVASFVPFLTAFAPLSPKLEELERLGFLRRRTAANANASGVVERRAETVQLAEPVARAAWVPAAVSTPSPTSLDAIDEAALARLAAGFEPARAAPESSLDAFSAELQALAGMMDGGATVSAPRAVPAPKVVPPPAGCSLRDVLDEMAGFLAATVGVDGLPITLALEQIGSIAQMRQELAGYAELVTPYGEPASAHLARVEAMLRRAA